MLASQSPMHAVRSSPPHAVIARSAPGTPAVRCLPSPRASHSYRLSASPPMTLAAAASASPCGGTPMYGSCATSSSPPASTASVAPTVTAVTPSARRGVLVTPPSSAVGSPSAVARTAEANRQELRSLLFAVVTRLWQAGTLSKKELSNVDSWCSLLVANWFDAPSALADVTDACATELGIPVALAQALRSEAVPPRNRFASEQGGSCESSPVSISTGAGGMLRGEATVGADSTGSQASPVTRGSPSLVDVVARPAQQTTPTRAASPRSAARTKNQGSRSSSPLGRCGKSPLEQHVERLRRGRQAKKQELHEMRISNTRSEQAAEPWVGTSAAKRSPRLVFSGPMRSTSIAGFERAVLCREMTADIAPTAPSREPSPRSPRRASASFGRGSPFGPPSRTVRSAAGSAPVLRSPPVASESRAAAGAVDAPASASPSKASPDSRLCAATAAAAAALAAVAAPGSSKGLAGPRPAPQASGRREASGDAGIGIDRLDVFLASAGIRDPTMADLGARGKTCSPSSPQRLVSHDTQNSPRAGSFWGGESIAESTFDGSFIFAGGSFVIAVPP
mmetsp:Transcript_69372/g.201236  ORF Transcript_69372/g.201236 Transcript_69372/m.201236 type:complete len:566 (+) Transcript_69372:84-1781(+)